MERSLPTGTVTFLFTDVEGSTRLLDELGPQRYAEALAEHRRVLREAFTRHGGVEVDTQGDAFFVAFSTAPGALAAAREAQDGLAIPVRMGIHTGTAQLTSEGYVGHDVHKAARIAAAGHGGQVLVSAATSALVGEELRDLGEHRLKDLSAPERIYQAAEGEFPPLKTLYRTNLPIPATPFLGREQELGEVDELLGRDDVRLLTLLGPGGTGKTRLALQAVAEAAERYPDGAFWVPLAPLRDPGLVLDAASQAVGAAGGLAEHLADKRVLLLLDNFEHLIAAASELVSLLQSCPNLSLVVTSRELLQIAAEQSYPVPPLERQDGVQLFVARARAVKPAFEPDEAVPALCERLENLPLALELAAARVRMLSPQQLLERLTKRLDLLKAGRDADPRQQTLRATIEWSYDLLNAEEQQLFARLAVFRGGCTLDAAERVCDADLDLLQSLVDKSLVRIRDGDRFWMLETIREYAVERLAEDPDTAAIHRRHIDYFVALAEEAWPHASEYDAAWLGRLETEHDNLRLALDLLAEAGDFEQMLALAADLTPLWGIRGFVREGRQRLQAALRPEDPPTPVRARGLTALAGLSHGEGDDEAAERLATQALRLHREFGDHWGICESLLTLGHVAANGNDFERTRQFAEQLTAESADEPGSVHALQATWLLAWAHNGLGDRVRARDLYEDALTRARAAEATNVAALALGSLASLAIKEGRPRDAIPVLKEAQQLNREKGDRWRLALEACRLARVAAGLGDAVTAVRLLASGKTELEQIGGAPRWRAREDTETVELARRDLDDAAYTRAWEEGSAVAPEEAFDAAIDALSAGA